MVKRIALRIVPRLGPEPDGVQARTIPLRVVRQPDPEVPPELADFVEQFAQLLAADYFRQQEASPISAASETPAALAATAAGRAPTSWRVGRGGRDQGRKRAGLRRGSRGCAMESVEGITAMTATLYLHQARVGNKRPTPLKTTSRPIQADAGASQGRAGGTGEDYMALDPLGPPRAGRGARGSFTIMTGWGQN